MRRPLARVKVLYIIDFILFFFSKDKNTTKLIVILQKMQIFVVKN
jgi:hypothetical protein